MGRSRAKVHNSTHVPVSGKRVNTSCELYASTWVTISMMDWIHAWESQSHLQTVSWCQSQSLTGVMNPDPRVIIYLWTKSTSKNHNSTFQLPPDVKFRSSSVVCIHVGELHFLLWLEVHIRITSSVVFWVLLWHSLYFHRALHCLGESHNPLWDTSVI